MENRTIIIGKKSAILALPYVKQREYFSPLIGNESTIKLIISAWRTINNSAPLNVLLIGEPGVGKTHLIEEISRILHKELYVFQGHDDVTPSDLACTVRFSDSDNRKMEYILSPLATAMIRGGIFYFDECAKVQTRSQALLSSALDHRSYIDSDLLGERIYAVPGFRFIGATNSGEQKFLPDFLKSRLIMLELPRPTREMIDKIVSTHFDKIQIDIRNSLSLFWILFNKHKKEKQLLPDTRQVISMFGLAHRLSLPYSEELNEFKKCVGIPDEKLELAFNVIFNKLN